MSSQKEGMVIQRGGRSSQKGGSDSNSLKLKFVIFYREVFIAYYRIYVTALWLLYVFNSIEVRESRLNMSPPALFLAHFFFFNREKFNCDRKQTADVAAYMILFFCFFSPWILINWL